MSFFSEEFFHPVCLLIIGVATISAGYHMAVKYTKRRVIQLSHPFETKILFERNILFLSIGDGDKNSLMDQVEVQHFCGDVITDTEQLPNLSGKHVYICGDISKAPLSLCKEAEKVFIVHDLAYQFDQSQHVLPNYEVVNQGRLPILKYGVGILYKQFFNTDANFFHQLQQDHEFQLLTESTKPGTAHRTGIYLTPVTKDGDDLHFRLLRCSSNLSGPSGNFHKNDDAIVSALNKESEIIFDQPAPLNHVLAQVYHNSPAGNGKKEIKAKIKEHSDKTKDMPSNGVMAFCTFYDHNSLSHLKPMGCGGYDYGYNGVSALTKLQFRLKAEVQKEFPNCNLCPNFSVTLYPNSVFLMPLSTNRLYTHEIKPAPLNAQVLPTRMGYVVRCSNTEAVHRSGKTYVKMKSKNGRPDALVELEAPTVESMTMLRKKYAEENITASPVDYGTVLFSMNKGDYSAPLLIGSETSENVAFRQIQLTSEDFGGGIDVFDSLINSVKFEGVCKGRRGTVMVNPDEARGVPIVRTTTKYNCPAQCFKPIHERIVNSIKLAADINTDFNNALIEHYYNSYATMGFHSDQALDLQDDSYVAVFSCYKYPNRANPAPRVLIVEPKNEGGGTFRVPMTHNGVIVFSLRNNCQFRHKIILDNRTSHIENEWLGITFRLSKTFINFNSKNLPMFEDGTILTLANTEQSQEFYKNRKFENQQIEFTYPETTFTISESDLIQPVP